ncbi:hypothetical protein SteCoe_35492 [Stentor coeruleus]|uniref:CRAL-TRIO domain-containing protein n=1 Tax=Stentor coeruleus TaxID=5963 RepID=A0A1R2AS59_9CILI|nr:hypothetical protein SteCoe_35492 [Stentor coeruleus]
MLDKLLIEGIESSKLPPETYNFNPPEDIILSPGKKIPLRNIFSHQNYSDQEKEKLSRLKEQITKAKLSLPPRYDDDELVRIIHGSGYKTRRALKDLKISIDAVAEMIPLDYKILFPKIYSLLNEGFLYIHGRDRYFRPLVVLDIPKIDLKKHTVQDYVDLTVFLMEFVIEYMLIPGKVENWINIVEMGRLGIRELPFKSLIKLLGTLQKIYKCRLAHSFVLNPPSSMYYMWTCLKPFIDKATQEKVLFENKTFCETMLQMCDLDQVEKRFGGNAPNIEEFWPPIFPYAHAKVNSDSEIHDQKSKSVFDISSKSSKKCENLGKYHIDLNDISDLSIHSDVKSVDNEHTDSIIKHELERIEKMDVQSCLNEEEYLEEEKEIMQEMKASEKKHKKKSKKKKKNKMKQLNEEVVHHNEMLYAEQKESELDAEGNLNEIEVVTAEIHENPNREFGCGGCFIY